MPVFVKDGKSVLFVHIPKTGGHALERAFVESGWEASLFDPRSRKHPQNRLRTCSPQHMHAALLRQLLRLERFDVVFAVVRDPRARFRSEFVWRHRDLRSVDAATVDAWADKVFAKYEDNPFAMDNHLRPQTEFLLPETVTFRFENGLDAVVDQLENVHGIHLSEPLRWHRRETVLSTGDVPISDSLSERIRDFYAADFEALQYEPLPPAGRGLIRRTRSRSR